MLKITLSIILVIFIPFVKIGMAEIFTSAEYTLYISVISLSLLMGSVCFGVYPSLFPDKIVAENKVGTDIISVFSFAILLFISVYQFGIYLAIVVVLIALFTGVHEACIYYYSLINRNDNVIRLDVINLLSYLVVFVMAIFAGFNYFWFIYIYTIFFIFVYAKFYKKRLGFIYKHIDKEISLMRVVNFLLQASVLLLPLLITQYFDARQAEITIVLIYLIGLPVAFNQLVVNRVLYSNFSNNKIYIYFSGILLIESASFYIITSFFTVDSFNLKTISYLFELNLFTFCFFLLSRLLFSLMYALSRLEKVKPLYSLYIESFKLVSTILIVYLYGYSLNGNDYNVNVLLSFLSLPFIFAAFIYGIIVYEKRFLLSYFNSKRS